MALASKLKRLDKIEPMIRAQSGKLEKTIYGVVDKVVDGKENIVRRWKGTIGHMELTDEEPTILIAEKLEPAILKHKKWKGFFGGRAGTKSIFAMDAVIGDANSCASRTYVLRETMKSLKESIYAGIETRISELGFKGFSPIPTNWEIRHSNGGKITFGGMRNVIDMKGSFKYKRFLLEEAAETKQETLDILGPTLRGVDDAELWMLWNPLSANDPMSTEFIIPYQKYFDKQGYYEDDHHLIIQINYRDNPWFMGDPSLRQELEKDKLKVEDGRMSKTRFNHIWEGGFNDDIEDGIIQADWFDSCIDAHKKLGFEALGAVTVSHDPSDEGKDAKGYACRKGVVFNDVTEIDAVNGNEAMDIACAMAIKAGADNFNWDCDGMGALLRRQVDDQFSGKKVNLSMFKGSEKPHRPEQTYTGVFSEEYNKGDVVNQVKNKDLFKNKRAQNYIELATRMYNTHLAITQGKYIDPEKLVSFSSDIKMLQKLKSELTKLPRKKNSSMIELYSKEEMRRGILMSDGSRRVIPSPNLADCVMMSFDDNANLAIETDEVYIPPAIKTVGRRGSR